MNTTKIEASIDSTVCEFQKDIFKYLKIILQVLKTGGFIVTESIHGYVSIP